MWAWAGCAASLPGPCTLRTVISGARTPAEILTGEPYAIPTLDENPYGKPPAMGPVTPELRRGLIQAEFGGDKLYQTYAANEPDPKVAELLLQNGREETRHGQRVEQVIALLGG